MSKSVDRFADDFKKIDQLEKTILENMKERQAKVQRKEATGGVIKYISLTI
jgi:hypothetical protein